MAGRQRMHAKKGYSASNHIAGFGSGGSLPVSKPAAAAVFLLLSSHQSARFPTAARTVPSSVYRWW